MSKKSQLELLTEAVEKLVAHPILPIAPVAPVAPVLPIVQQHSGDHDLLTSFRAETLVELKTIKDALIKMQELAANSPTRTEHNEVLKLQIDHEARMRVVETAVNKILTLGIAGIFVLGIIQFIVGKYF